MWIDLNRDEKYKISFSTKREMVYMSKIIYDHFREVIGVESKSLNFVGRIEY